MPGPSKLPSASPSSSSPSSFKSGLILLGALGLALAVGLFLARDSGDRNEDSQAKADKARPEAQGGSQANPATGPARKPLEPLWTKAAGRVESVGGEAIAGAVVTLAPLDEDAGAPRTVVTDAGGSWSMREIAVGRYSLSATATGYLAGLRPELKLGAKADNAGLDLELERGGVTLSGTVADKTGGVVEGALVQLTPQSGITRMRERESYFTLSDEQGRYAVQVPPGRHRVRASHADYSSELVVLEFAAAALTQDFALVPTAVIEGVVLRESDDTPVAHAAVTWSKQRDMVLPNGERMSVFERGGKVRAGPEGQFRISGLPPGTIELSARASQLASFSGVQVPVGIAERVEDLELRLAAASDVRGRVVALNEGEGIAGATVELASHMGGADKVFSNENGDFLIPGVLPGHYRVLADAEGWTGSDGPPVTLDVGTEAPSPVDVELARASSIRGRVEPAAHAEVSIELNAENMQLGGGGLMMLASAEPAHADAQTGVFELKSVKPGHYTLQARTADGRGGSVEVDVGPEGASEVVLELDARASLTGRVEDYTGKLLSDVSVRARKQTPGASVSVIVNGRELTASSSPTTTEGKFELVGLEAGAWSVEVVDRQGNPLAMEGGKTLEVELGQGEPRELVLRVEPRDGTITGVVRDAEGSPVIDAWVSASFVAMAEGPGDSGHAEQPEGSRMQMTMMMDTGASSISNLPPVLTGPEGRFRFENLHRGEYTLIAELDGGASKATAEGVRPDADIKLDLAPLGTIEGKVSSDGKPINCIARIMGPTERVVRVRDGAFEVERLEPGLYQVEARTPEGATRVEVEVEAGDTADVELSLQRFATITGTIVDESGAPVVGAEVMIGAGEGGRIEISREDGDPQYFTDEAGAFEANAAAGGRVLLAQMPGIPMPIVIHPFVVEGGKDIDLGQLSKQDTGAMMVMEGEGEPEGEPEG